MIETMLWRFVEHRKRCWIVIIATAGISLLLVLPAVDNYTAVRSRLKNFQSDLARMQASVSQADNYRGVMQKREEQLATLDRQAFSPDDVERFRNELVDLVRDLGCQMRRIRVGDATLQMELAAALNEGGGDKLPQGWSEIYGQPLSLQVTGPLNRINELLKRIHAHEGMVQTQTFSLKRSDENPELTNLDLDLLLMDLRKPKGKNS